MTSPQNAPQRPRRCSLVRHRGGRLPQYVTADMRFVLTRNPGERGHGGEPGVPFEDSGYQLVDTKRANILGSGHSNEVRVYELDDARALIDRVRDLEWLADVQRFHDTERKTLGLPTVAEEAAARSRRQRTGIDEVAGRRSS
jgi:hypothetical protein